jgi:low affinity Fe/Cu permease
MNDFFHKFAGRSAELLGTPWAFLVAGMSIVLWALTGPLFHFSDTWQLIANTGTTLVTFLMVFLIQNTQNRDAKAIHLKLDELIRGVRGARNRLVDLEDLSDEELAQLQEEFRRLHEHYDHDTGRHDAESSKGKKSERSPDEQTSGEPHTKQSATPSTRAKAHPREPASA